jgi:hypothetical protein
MKGLIKHQVGVILQLHECQTDFQKKLIHSVNGRYIDVVVLMKRKERAVSRHLPIVAVRFQSHVRSCGIFDGQNDTGADFI